LQGKTRIALDKREAELQLVKTQSCALLVKRALRYLISFTCITPVMLFTCNALHCIYLHHVRDAF